MVRKKVNKIEWYHYVVWVLGVIALILLAYGIIRNLVS